MVAVRSLPPKPRSRLVRLLDRPLDAGSRLWGRAQASGRVARARCGYGLGVLVAAWGVGVQFGLGWSLMVAGVTCAGSFLLLYPVDTP